MSEVSKKNANFIVTKRRDDVLDLYLRNFSQAAIAERLHVSQSTVSSDIQFLLDQWRQSGIAKFDQHFERQLQKIELLEREAWAGWERSQKSLPIDGTTDEDTRMLERQALKDQMGEHRFLGYIHKCLLHRSALLCLGTDTPLVDALQVDDVASQSSQGDPPRLRTSEQLRALVNEALQEIGRDPLPEPEETFERQAD